MLVFLAPGCVARNGRSAATTRSKRLAKNQKCTPAHTVPRIIMEFIENIFLTRRFLLLRHMSRAIALAALLWIPATTLAQKPPKPHFYEFAHAFHDPWEYQHPERVDTFEYSKIRIYHYLGRQGTGLRTSEFKHGSLREMRRVPQKEVYVLSRQDEIELVPILCRQIDYNEEKYLCLFEPHHAIVFFDRRGSVLAYIELCFTCHEGGSGHRGIYFDRPMVSALEFFMHRCGFKN